MIKVEMSEAFGGREPFVDLTTAARFLSVSARTLRRWLAESTALPHHRFGGVLRFRLSEVERWARANR